MLVDSQIQEGSKDQVQQLLYVLMEPGQVGVEVAVVGVDVVGLVVVVEGIGLVGGGWRCCPVVVKMLLL